MKLFELARGSHFRLLEKPAIPPDAPFGVPTMEYKLTNIDGMYSHCVGEDNEVYHFAAWTEVKEV